MEKIYFFQSVTLYLPLVLRLQCQDSDSRPQGCQRPSAKNKGENTASEIGSLTIKTQAVADL